MQQERQLSEEQEETPEWEDPQEYRAHINELISEPAADNVATIAAQYILNSLYQLSSYLFTKKIQNSQGEASEITQPLELSFDSYLQVMAEDMGQFDKIRTTHLLKRKTESLNMEAELLKCYEKVERIYFEENYILDMSYFEYFFTELKTSKKGGKERVERSMDKLCQCLDMVQINLFSQIHCKFQEYFKVVANFEYLKESVTLHLRKIKASRSSTNKVKTQFLQKSVKLRKKIVQRQNIEKVLQLIKKIKSIKKLPQVLESILASSLPYEALSLLEESKEILSTLKQIRCLKNTAELIRSMQALVQNDMTKRYANELYTYLEECHDKDVINLQELWKKIEVYTCLDKDSSFVLDQLNSSTNSALSDNPQLLEELELMDYGSDAAIASSTLLPRHEGKEYQIAMILLQSYKYMTFSPEVTKIKVSNSLRIFVKRFQKELLLYLNSVVESEIENIKVRQKNTIVESQGKVEVPTATMEEKGSEEEDNKSFNVVDKVSVQFYIKHLGVLNQIFRQTINRFLGYLTTLITEYEQEFAANCDHTTNSQPPKGFLQNHKRFKQVFQEECQMLPNIFKIIEQKIKYLLTLKNISNIDSLQFYRWITTLKYWKRYFDNLAQTHPLLNYDYQKQSQQYIRELTSIVQENVKKAVQTMNLQVLLYELTKDYVQVFHKKTIQNQIVHTLEEETWQSTEIPSQFSEIMQAIFNPEGNALNASITILDSSTSSARGSLNNSRDKESSRQEDSLAKNKIKLLKNNILIGGVRYKVNISFLVLCEWLGEYMKMARILGNVFDRDSSNPAYRRVVGEVYDKLYDLIESFCLKSKELIHDAKALTLGKLKSKGINAKHITLLCNCLSVLIKIAEDMLDAEKVDRYSLEQKRKNTLLVLQTTKGQLITKLTNILNSKIEKEIKQFLQADGLNTATSQVASKTSHIIITFFLQMVEVTDEYLEVEEVKIVLKPAFQTLSQKYLTNLLLKGGKQRADVEVLIEKLKFLRKYFPVEYQNLQKEIPT